MVLAFLLLLATVPRALLAQGDPEAWIRQLGSDTPSEREVAAKALLGMGAAAIPALEKASQNGSVDLASRSLSLLRILRTRDRLSPALRKALPDAERRILTDGDPAWTALFLEAVETEGGGRRKHPELTSADVDPLSGPALRAADPSRLPGVCREIALWNCRSAIPDLLRTLEDSEASHRLAALRVLVEFRSPESASAVPALLKDGDPEIRAHAADLARILRVKAAEGVLIRSLEDEALGVRTAAIRALGEIRAKAAIPEIARLLKDDGPGVAPAAIDALARLGARDHLASFVDALQRPATSERAYMALVRLRARTALPQVLPLLGHENATVRQWSVRTLGSLRAREAIAAVAVLLQDPDGLVRSYALIALQDIGGDGSTPALVSLLKAGDEDLSFRAAGALRDLDAVDTVGLLLPLLGDPRPNVRGNAAVALGGLRAGEAEAGLRALLKDEVLLVRVKAVKALGHLGSAEAAPAIATFLRNEKEWVRAEAVEALREIGSLQVVPDLLALLEDPNPGIRKDAMAALGALRATSAAAALSMLLKDPAPEQRLAAARALSGGGMKGAVTQLRTLLNDSSPALRNEVPWLLAELGDVDIAATLIERMKAHSSSTSPTDRDRTIDALARIRAAVKPEDIVALLRLNAHEVREDAVRVLGFLEAISTIPAITGLLGDPSEEVRAAAVQVLGGIDAREAASHVEVLLRDSSTRVRMLALDTLGRLKPERNGSAVVAALGDSEPEVRRVAAWAVPELGLKEGIPAMEALLGDDDADVRISAAAGLCRLGSSSGMALLLEEAAWDEGIRLFDLNALRRPDAWRLVGAARSPAKGVPRRKAIEDLAGGMGMALELGSVRPRDLMVPLPSFAGGRSGFETPAGRLRSLLSTNRYDTVLEEGRLRLLGRAAALDFWVDWSKRRAARGR